MSNLFMTLRGTPFLTNPFLFFSADRKNRTCLFITDSNTQWKRDLVIGERTFADVIVCPFRQSIEKDMIQVKEILEKRSAFPGLSESPEADEIAKTWILAKKVHEGPDASLFLQPDEGSVKQTLRNTLLSTFPDYDDTIQILRLDVQNGHERPFLYKILDEGFRPSLIIVRWSHDLDDHHATAICAGHLMNCGYFHVYTEGNQSLYLFADQPLYDICSLKETGQRNLFLQAILQSATTQSTQSTQSTVISSTT